MLYTFNRNTCIKKTIKHEYFVASSMAREVLVHLREQTLYNRRFGRGRIATVILIALLRFREQSNILRVPVDVFVFARITSVPDAL